MPPRPSAQVVVSKFGGAALADAPGIRRTATIIAGEQAPQVVVVSALSGVTDQLLQLADRAVAGDAATAVAIARGLRRRHRNAALALLPRGRQRPVLEAIEASLDEAERLAESLAVVREVSPRTRDHLLACGERLSALLVAAVLMGRGRRPAVVDATTLIPTDGRFGEAFPDLAATDRLARRRLRPLLAARGAVVVVPGFIGASPAGETVTLGRGGSDLSAIVLARALGAPEVSLWKDVPGFLTADPRVVPEARLLPSLHAREAAELAYYGAKVLHPRALVPLTGRRTQVRVRPFADPSAPGTLVGGARPEARFPVRAVTAIRAQAMVTVEGSGMLGVPGIAERAFAALHAAGISVSLISQASSEHSICFTVPAAQSAAARDRVRDAFREELAHGDVDDVTVRRGLATLAVVGLGMAGTPGVAARVFRALADMGVNLVAIAQGSSELNISVVVDEGHADRGVRAVHRAFQLDKVGGGQAGGGPRVDVFLLGFGQIGRLLAGMLPAVRSPELRFRVVGVADRSGVVFDPGGIGARRLRALATGKAAGTPLARQPGGAAMSAEQAVAHAAAHALERPILVDCTADDTSTALLVGLRGGMDLVLANKQPLTGPIEWADLLRVAAAERGRHLLHEATVGAGLPVLSTFGKLVESGDRVRRIEGCLSGTLGFVFSELERGRPFSAVLREALAKGYTEPDPRDDLSGLDVGRKALTLARLLGYGGELSDIAIESLVPPAARTLTRDRFVAALESHDAAWSARVAAARAQGKVLRYVAEATGRSVRVGLRAVGPSSPFAALRGSDNQVVFTTDRYRDRPLVITGPGAGPAVTAAGVLNDILTIARQT